MSYRRDEAKRKEEIEKAMALHTPEGDLKANILAIDQLKDAGAHGATASPDYAATMQNLTTTKTSLETALQTQRTQSTPDDRLSIATSTSATPTAPELSPDVLAAMRKISAGTEPAGAAHGLDNKVAAVAADQARSV